MRCYRGGRAHSLHAGDQASDLVEGRRVGLRPRIRREGTERRPSVVAPGCVARSRGERLLPVSPIDSPVLPFGVPSGSITTSTSVPVLGHPWSHQRRSRSLIILGHINVGPVSGSVHPVTVGNATKLWLRTPSVRVLRVVFDLPHSSTLFGLLFVVSPCPSYDPHYTGHNQKRADYKPHAWLFTAQSAGKNSILPTVMP